MVVGEFTQETNLVVIGGGPGGYTAAFRAAELGIETLIVDTRETLGGAYLHQGCVASKALLHLLGAVDGQVVPRLIMPLSLSFDHRLIDGAQEVHFMRRIITALENPGELVG